MSENKQAKAIKKVGRPKGAKNKKDLPKSINDILKEYTKQYNIQKNKKEGNDGKVVKKVAMANEIVIERILSKNEKKQCLSTIELKKLINIICEKQLCMKNIDGALFIDDIGLQQLIYSIALLYLYNIDFSDNDEEENYDKLREIGFFDIMEKRTKRFEEDSEEIRFAIYNYIKVYNSTLVGRTVKSFLEQIPPIEEWGNILSNIPQQMDELKKTGVLDVVSKVVTNLDKGNLKVDKETIAKAKQDAINKKVN